MKQLIKTKGQFIIIEHKAMEFPNWFYVQNINCPTFYFDEESYMNSMIKGQVVPTVLYHSSYAPVSKSISELTNWKEILKKIGEVDADEIVFSLFGFPQDRFDGEDWSKHSFGVECYNRCLEDNKEKEYTKVHLEMLYDILGFSSFKSEPLEQIEIFKEFIKKHFIDNVKKNQWDIEIIDNQIKLL